MNRREFIATMSLGFASAIAIASCDRSEETSPTPTDLKFMPFSGGEITRFALIGDATSLALQKPLPALVSRALKGIPGLSSILGMGMTFPAQDLDSVITFLSKARSNIFDFKDEEQDNQHRVAIATGYLMHRAIARRVEDRLATAGIDPAEHNTAKFYQDAETLRNLTDFPQTKVEVRHLLSIVDRRMRIKMHTLRPDGSDEKAWVLKLLAWDTAQENFFDRLASTIAEPESSKRHHYVTALNFFDPDSPLTNAARNGKVVKLLSTSPKSSLYELALNDCREIVEVVGQFIDGASADSIKHKLI